MIPNMHLNLEFTVAFLGQFRVRRKTKTIVYENGCLCVNNPFYIDVIMIIVSIL